MTQARENFSIRPAEVEQARVMLSSMVKDLSDRFPKMKKPEGAQAQSQPAPASQPTPPVATPTIPLNAANLQQQQQQLSKIHQRSGSRGSQPPAAPTSSQPPFQFGATSPHGAPKYSGTPAAITQENLHIPARKKQRQNNNTPAQSTPGANASPRINKPVSPETKRQQIPDSKPKPSLCCPEPECDRHQVSFDTEEALKNHTEQEHVRPSADPAKYAQENLAAILGLDSQGQSNKPGGPTLPDAKVAASGTPNPKGEGTPAGANTPTNRQVSMSRQGTSNTKAPSEPAKNNSADPKNSSKQPAQEADPWASYTINPHDIFQDFQGFESGASGAISDMNVYRSITPNDTPESSKDGLSEPNSDISEGVGLDINLDIFDENWQPFGSDADFLADMNGINVNGEQDMVMLEEDPVTALGSWDDMIDPTAFDKPFQFDNSLYSMNAA
jgi:hypothetical protein